MKITRHSLAKPDAPRLPMPTALPRTSTWQEGGRQTDIELNSVADERQALKMSNGYRQEVFNVLLAQLLQERGVITAPESVLKAGPESARRIPDLIVSFYGLRTVIEGEVEDQPNAEIKAIAAAGRRVQDGIAHIGVAIVYPAELRKVDFKELKRRIADSRLRVAVVTDSEETGFVIGDVDYIDGALRHAFEQLVEEDAVAKAVAVLDAGIERFARAIIDKPGILGRAAKALGIRELPKKEETESQGESD